ncbi:InlB B-repeat-containing protein [Erysipelothrix anatis]|uniref:EndoS/ChiA family endoglycosidase n=1 Tax=Erysipelothrix anatis TaxID=2683713 RepID=UPI00135B2669|nr:InlB B-repeat-containing protein [Erysipelothrix anatis]
MKKLVKRFSLIMFIVLMGMGSLIPIHAQTRGVGPEMNYDEPIMMAYYRTWRDAAMPHDSNSNLPDENVIKMTDLPAEIDIVSVFHYVNPGTDQDLFWETLKNEYVPTLHERGQRVVRTLDYKELLKIKTTTGKDSTTLTDADYHAFAQSLIDTYMTPWNLDGLDVDMETNLNSEEVAVISNVFIQLSDILQIKEGSDKLLIYDTNKDNHDLFREIAPHISYLFIQAYGRNPQSLDRTWETYQSDISSTRVLFGVSFYEEQDNTNWNDALGKFSEEKYLASRAYQYAKWQPKNGEKGGMFVYAVDRDGKDYRENTISETDFAWTKRMMQTLDESRVEKIEDITIEFRNSQNELLKSETLKAAYNSEISIEIPTLTGYVFNGDLASLKYTVKQGPQTVVVSLSQLFDVTFEVNGGSNVSSQKIVEDGVVTIPTEPTRLGYTFDGWYTDVAFANRFDFDQKMNQNTTLYAKWNKQAVSYTLSFETGEGSKVSPQTVLENTTALVPANPTREGYTFDGWYTSAQFTTKFDFGTHLTADTTVYAKWQKVTPIGPVTPTKPKEVLPATGASNTLMNFAVATSIIGGSLLAINMLLKRKSEN